MARILVQVEGQTEETFVNEVLSPHLFQFHHYISARLIGNARQRARRGGICGWDAASRDIMTHLKSDANIYVTTMVDYYALPASGIGAWPGRAEAAAKRMYADKATVIHQALLDDITGRMDANFRPDHFIPYVLMHEFEALLFSDCQSFAQGIAKPELAGRFEAIRQDFTTPEEINDSPLTAPSKRVENLVPGYEKPLLGNLAILEIGLSAIRRECLLFGQWLTTLEKLPEV